jgi:hypothetical protein
MARPNKPLTTANTPYEALTVAVEMGRIVIPCESKREANSVRARLSSCRSRIAKRYGQDKEAGGHPEAAPEQSLNIRQDGTDVIVEQQQLPFYVPED